MIHRFIYALKSVRKLRNLKRINPTRVLYVLISFLQTIVNNPRRVVVADLRYALKFFNYLLFAKHKKGHGIHSPFVFNLIKDVFNNTNDDKDLQKVFDIYNKFKKSTEVLNYYEIGAGSTYKSKNGLSVGQIIKRSSINKKYGRLIFNLIKYFKPENILELGTSVGISTLYIAQAAKNSKFTTVEGVSEKIEIARKITEECNHKQINFECGDFDKILSLVLNKFDKLDFVYFDGNHKKNSTIKYFEACLNKIHNESIFIFDDIHWSKEMEEAWSFILNHKEVTISIDTYQWGIVFFRKEQPKEHYIIRV